MTPCGISASPSRLMTGDRSNVQYSTDSWNRTDFKDDNLLLRMIEDLRAGSDVNLEGSRTVQKLSVSSLYRFSAVSESVCFSVDSASWELSV